MVNCKRWIVSGVHNAKCQNPNDKWMTNAKTSKLYHPSWISFALNKAKTRNWERWSQIVTSSFIFQPFQLYPGLCLGHLIAFTNKFEFSHVFGGEFPSDFVKSAHSLRPVQSLATVQAHFGLHLHDCRIRASFEDFFDLFFYEFSTADRAFIQKFHY